MFVVSVIEGCAVDLCVVQVVVPIIVLFLDVQELRISDDAGP